ncbi:hypothetical protein Hamer_G011555 [Homarus americanus]|uniref:Uncharacterized protein n=1 Tax=Homarus americanus TaxID=6706 RepID=A0A8J5K442_HOMAM|nr:hypothetical protein Hamer_G011555 [Homarus americanus]
MLTRERVYKLGIAVLAVSQLSTQALAEAQHAMALLNKLCPNFYRKCLKVLRGLKPWKVTQTVESGDPQAHPHTFARTIHQWSYEEAQNAHNEFLEQQLVAVGRPVRVWSFRYVEWAGHALATTSPGGPRLCYYKSRRATPWLLQVPEGHVFATTSPGGPRLGYYKSRRATSLLLQVPEGHALATTSPGGPRLGYYKSRRATSLLLQVPEGHVLATTIPGGPRLGYYNSWRATSWLLQFLEGHVFATTSPGGPRLGYYKSRRATSWLLQVPEGHILPILTTTSRGGPHLLLQVPEGHVLVTTSPGGPHPDHYKSWRATS